jgi:TOBE domain-containing protein
VVRLELDLTGGGGIIEAHIARGQYEQLALAKGQRVYVSPTNARVFAQPA